MVQPDDGLAFEIAIAWNDQQGRDAGFSNGEKKRKNDLHTNELPPRWKYLVGHQLA